MNRSKANLLFFLLIPSLHATLHAQDRQFARTYQSGTLPRGNRDLEGWITYRTGRNYFFNRLDTRLEFETGLTDKLQTSVYLNLSQSLFGANRDTLGGIPDPSVSGTFTALNFSVSSEWKLNLLNPSVDPVGLALYAEFLLGPGTRKIENKMILDKRWRRDLVALNMVNEYEVEKSVSNGVAEGSRADEVEIDMGYMHLITPRFGVGLEGVNNNEIKEGRWNFSALFGGPTFYYSGDNNFFIFSLLTQWSNLHKTPDAPARLVLNDHEKIELRLLWGFSL